MKPLVPLTSNESWLHLSYTDLAEQAIRFLQGRLSDDLERIDQALHFHFFDGNTQAFRDMLLDIVDHGLFYECDSPRRPDITEHIIRWRHLFQIAEAQSIPKRSKMVDDLMVREERAWKVLELIGEAESKNVSINDDDFVRHLLIGREDLHRILGAMVRLFLVEQHDGGRRNGTYYSLALDGDILLNERAAKKGCDLLDKRKGKWYHK